MSVLLCKTWNDQGLLHNIHQIGRLFLKIECVTVSPWLIFLSLYAIKAHLGLLLDYFQTGWLLNALQWSKMWGYCWVLLHHKVILFYESEGFFFFFFLGGGGLILGLLFRRSEHGLCWSQMDIISLEMDSMTPKTPDNIYHTYCFMKT